jgi:hypothetical protein
LTAWRVRARTITLERGAQANIMLQESESLDLDRNARLVGNFASEKELYLMLGRFSRELRDLPTGVFADDDVAARIASGEASTAEESTADPHSAAPEPRDEASPTRRQEESEVLSLVRVILEREIARVGPEGVGREPLEKLLELIRTKNHDRLRESYRYLISQVESPTEELERAREILAKMLASG